MQESNLPVTKILENISCVKKTKERKEVKEIITYYGISIFLFRPYKPRFPIALFITKDNTTSNEQQMYQYYFYSSTCLVNDWLGNYFDDDYDNDENNRIGKNDIFCNNTIHSIVD